MEKEQILERAKQWFRDTIAVNHIRNTEKLRNPEEFQINPFLAVYLANFLTGKSDPECIAKALVYPRVLGTSITTSFGQNIQSFTSDVLGGFGSAVAGIDIEFVDKVDGNRKYCQLKAGPNTINKDDVESIAGHFKGIINLARVNKLKLGIDDLVVGVMYGLPQDLSSHYKRITRQYHYPVVVGQDFWHRLTGDIDFYKDLLEAIGSVAVEANFSTELEAVIQALSVTDTIKNIK